MKSGVLGLSVMVLVGWGVLVAVPGEAHDFYVAKTGADSDSGDVTHPFLTIQKAADIAQAGDTVTVATGVYRERVDPKHGGTAGAPIIYRAAAGADVRIMGSEQVAGWKRVGDIWEATLPKAFFPDQNPFATSIKHPKPVKDGSEGDWGWLRYGKWAHTGDIYLNGRGLVETETEAGLVYPMAWHATVEADGTTRIKANFGTANPNHGQVEVNVRPVIFYPSTPGLSFITVKGFTLMNAATHWAPPTVEQAAAVGPNGGNHWTIEDNVILNSKGTCLSIGMPSGPADQAASGYHTIRDNVIMRCGQAGIVGQLWNSHTRISGNQIEDINYRREFGGAETGGIKLHFSHDTVIENNFVYKVYTLDKELANADGIWLDAANHDDIIRGNVVVGAMGAAILMEADYVGANLIESNVLVGGRAATYSSKDTIWRYNLLAGAEGYWVNQKDLKRPDIAGASWSRNIFIGTDIASGPDAAHDNLYLGGGQPREGEIGAVQDVNDPDFTIQLNGPVVRLQFNLPAAALNMPGDPSNGSLDFYGRARDLGAVKIGPFPQVTSGRNTIDAFRYRRGRERAEAILSGH